MDPLRRRLAPLIAATFVGSLWLWVPVEKLFLARIGFTPETIGVMAAVYSATVPLVDVPSGILADRWSRRGVLVVGNVCAVLGCVVGGLSSNVAVYLVAAALLGVYFAMESGTLDAIVYDTVLEETGSSDEFETVLGRLRMVESAALVLGGLGGGALAALTSPRVTYFVTAPFVLASIALLARFREPALHQRGERRSLRQHLAQTVGAVRHNRGLVPVVAVLVLTSVLSQAVYEFGPLWLLDGHAGAAAFGPAWAALMAAIGFGGALAGRVRLDRAGGRALLAALLVGGSAVLLVTSQVAVVTAAQVVVAIVTVVLGIVFTRMLHDAAPSDVRAGVASGVGTITWMTFLPVALVFGAVSQHLGIHAAGWLLVAAAAAIGVVILALGCRAADPDCRAEPAPAELAGAAAAA